MAAATQQILIIGLGDIAQVHLQVLERMPSADVVADVDVASRPGVTFRAATRSLYTPPPPAPPATMNRTSS